MRSYLKKIAIASTFTAFSFVVAPAVDQFSDLGLIATVHAEEGHDSGHGSSGHKGKGPKYKGGRGAEGHGGSDSAHKGESSHGGGSKTLEDTVFRSKGGKKYMGGGKGGHEETEGGHEDGETHDHTE